MKVDAKIIETNDGKFAVVIFDIDNEEKPATILKICTFDTESDAIAALMLVTEISQTDTVISNPNFVETFKNFKNPVNVILST
jgi:hypothetical protein